MILKKNETINCNKIIFVYLYRNTDNMISGRRERVVISCVTFETVKITDPIKFYEATRVHLIHYIRNPDSPNGKIYAEFHDRVCEIINDNTTAFVEVVSHKENVNDFTAMLRTILQIVEKENQKEEPVDVFVNISAGTSEYAAAAAIASMMMPNTIPFSVRTDLYQVDEMEKVKRTFYENEKPVGLSKSVKPPRRLPKYSMPIPDRNIVLGLRLLNDMNKNKHPPKGPEMIRILKDNNLWRREVDKDIPNDQCSGDNNSRSDSVYYYRDYVSRWLSNEWVYRDDFKKRYFLTEKGEIVLGTFYYP